MKTSRTCRVGVDSESHLNDKIRTRLAKTYLSSIKKNIIVAEEEDSRVLSFERVANMQNIIRTLSFPSVFVRMIVE